MRDLISLQVINGSDICLTAGIHAGTPLDCDRLPEVGEACALEPSAHLYRLTVSAVGAALVVDPTSEIGQAGRQIDLCGAMRLHCAEHLSAFDLAVLRIEGGQTLMVSSQPIKVGCDYIFSSARHDVKAAQKVLAETTALTFAPGTHILMADHTQKDVADILEGEYVETQTRGPQQVRWIGQVEAAADPTTPLVYLAPGVLGNQRSMVLMGNHYLFTERNQNGETEPAQVLRAKSLGGAECATQDVSGRQLFVQLLLDDHAPLIAEGLPTQYVGLDRLLGQLTGEAKWSGLENATL